MRPILPCLLALVLALPTHARVLHYSTGTGFFVNKEGFVVTNAHVVPGCREITVDGRPARLVAADATLDIAVLKVVSPSLTIAPLRLNINALAAGDKVIVMGFPGAEGAKGKHTYRTGKVLVPERPLRLPDPNPTGATVTVMAIDPIAAKGNSGGPVLDELGRVIGVIRATGSMFEANARTKQVIPGSTREATFAIPLALLTPYLKQQGVRMQFEHGGLIRMDDARMVQHARQFILPIRCLTRITP